MFIPNNTCTVAEVTGRSIRGGEATYGLPVRTRCAIVRLQPKAQKTSVRADSSATKGSSDQIVADAVMLFPSNAGPGQDAIVEIGPVRLRVIGSEPRFSVLGRLDHFQVSLEYYGAK